MSEVNIYTDPNSFQGKGEETTGKICIGVDQYFFPERDWNDFITTILHWWLDQASKISSGASTKEEFAFMDGPFYFIISSFNDTSTIELWHRDKGLFTTNSFIWEDFYNSLWSTAKTLIEYHTPEQLLGDKTLLNIKHFLQK